MRMILETTEIRSAKALKKPHRRMGKKDLDKYWHICATLSARTVGMVNHNNSAYSGIDLHRWKNMLTAVSPRFRKRLHISSTCSKSSKQVHGDRVKELTTENRNKRKQQSVISTSTIRTTMTNKDAYRRTDVRKPPKPGRPVLTNHIDSRMQLNALGRRQAQLTKP